MPKFENPDTTDLLGTSAGDSTNGAVTILAAEDIVADGETPNRPPGEPEVQTIRVYDLALSASDNFDGDPAPGFVLSMNQVELGCLSWDADAAEVETLIESSGYGDVVVTRSTPPIDEIWGLPSTPAPNGYTWTITYWEHAGDVPNPDEDDGLKFGYPTDSSNAACTFSDFTDWQRVDAETLVDGIISTVACDTEGCVDGVVLRGEFSEFLVEGDTCSSGAQTLAWNAEADSIRDAIQDCSSGDTPRQVDVSRSVIDQYGTMEWVVTFTSNPGISPTGAGDVADLKVTQDDSASQPIVIETQKGSTGLSGTFLLDYNDAGGSREVRFDEDVNRMQRKLEEMSTISDVYVDREEYPSAESGGWGGVAVDDETVGGYVWKIRFLAVPGAYNGNTFPAGTGNVDAIVPSVSSLAGTSATVFTTTVTEGAVEMSGGFALSFAGEVTETLKYTADGTAVEAVLEDLSNIGDVSVSFDPYTPTQIEDVTVTVGRDSSIAVVSSTTDVDLRNFLSPGVVIRIGGENASADGTLVGTNGEGYLDYPGGEGHMYVSAMP